MKGSRPRPQVFFGALLSSLLLASAALAGEQPATFSLGIVLGRLEKRAEYRGQMVDRGQFIVRAVIPGSPAERAGLQEHDELINIDAFEVAGLSLERVLHLLSGSSATIARLLIEREGRRFGLAVQRESRDSIFARLGLREEGQELLPIQDAPSPDLGELACLAEDTTATTGQPIRLEDFVGKLVLLTFWTSWCAHCREDVSYLTAALGQHGSALAIVDINLDEERGRFENALRSREFEAIRVFDGGWGGANAREFQIARHGVPYTILVGRDGTIRALELTQESILDALERFVDEP